MSEDLVITCSLLYSCTALSSAQKGSGNGSSVGLAIALGVLVIVGTVACPHGRVVLSQTQDDALTSRDTRALFV